jgi:hypothetical protein
MFVEGSKVNIGDAIPKRVKTAKKVAEVMEVG